MAIKPAGTHVVKQSLVTVKGPSLKVKRASQSALIRIWRWELQLVKSLCVQWSSISSSKCTHDTLTKFELLKRLNAAQWAVYQIRPFMFHCGGYLCSMCCLCSYICLYPRVMVKEYISMFNSSTCWFQPLLLDLESIFLSIPPSPSFLMNDSDDFRPEASGNLCEHHLSGELSLGYF